MRPEVAEIVDTPHGLWVTCEVPRRSLYVPRWLDGFDDVRELLRAWGPTKELRGVAAHLRAMRERSRQAPRDAVKGTALESDPTLVMDLEALRAASRERAHVRPGPVIRSRAVLALWILLVVLFLAIWQFLQPSKDARGPQTCTSACAYEGLCRNTGTSCTAASDTDCRASRACASFGRCKAYGGVCVAGGDDDCKRSEACARSGLCALVGCKCAATSDDDCRAAGVCRTDGRCRATAGRCEK